MRNSITGENIAGPDSFRFIITAAMGNAQLPFTLPRDAMPFQILTMTTSDWDATKTATVNLGTAPGGSDIGSLTIPTVAQGVAKMDVTGYTWPANGQLWISAVSKGSVNGRSIIAFQFDR